MIFTLYKEDTKQAQQMELLCLFDIRDRSVGVELPPLAARGGEPLAVEGIK